jgi:hypothetical protein
VSDQGTISPAIGLRTRFLFEDGNPASLAAQWAGRRLPTMPVLALLRTVPEDPFGADTIGLLWPELGRRSDAIEAAWAAAELAAGATLIGLALGARVALVPSGAHWHAELVAIRTGQRLPMGDPTSRPEWSLEGARSALIASLGVVASE